MLTPSIGGCTMPCHARWQVIKLRSMSGGLVAIAWTRKARKACLLYHCHQVLPSLLTAAGWAPWEPPQLTLPQWCDSVSDVEGNRAFTRLPQHPCAFMRNATAAALAARGTVD